MPRRRLEGEAVRDALLAVSGQLDPRVGGPSVFPDLPPGRRDPRRLDPVRPRPPTANRRSLYVFVRRNLKYPLFDAFDAPDTNMTCPERNISVNAPQALMLLNSDLVLDQARPSPAASATEAGDRGELARRRLASIGPTDEPLGRGVLEDDRDARRPGQSPFRTEPEVRPGQAALAITATRC